MVRTGWVVSLTIDRTKRGHHDVVVGSTGSTRQPAESLGRVARRGVRRVCPAVNSLRAEPVAAVSPGRRRRAGHTGDSACAVSLPDATIRPQSAVVPWGHPGPGRCQPGGSCQVSRSDSSRSASLAPGCPEGRGAPGWRSRAPGRRSSMPPPRCPGGRTASVARPGRRRSAGHMGAGLTRAVGRRSVPRSGAPSRRRASCRPG